MQSGQPTKSVAKPLRVQSLPAQLTDRHAVDVERRDHGASVERGRSAVTGGVAVRSAALVVLVVVVVDPTLACGR